MHQKNYWIYRRLEIYTYMQFPQVFKHEIILSIMWYFNNPQTHHEYYNLIKASFAILPTYIKQKIFKLIDAGFDSEQFERRRKKYGKDSTIDMEKHWKLVHLEPIKHELDEEHNKMHSELTEELGVPDHPDYLSYHTQSTKQSTSDPDFFNNKTIDQVFETVKNHSAPNEAFGSNYGIRITFEEYVKRNPLECSVKSSELTSTDLTIQYALFSGLTSAIQDDKCIKWENVLSLIEHIISSTTYNKNYSLEEYDPTLRICSLLEQGLQKDALDFQLKCNIWKIIELLVKIGTNGSNRDSYPSNQTDSLSVSINNINGMSFHLLCQYAIWCEKHDKNKKVLVPEVKQIFDDYLNKKLGQHTISRHAVLGLFLPDLYHLDQKWLKRIFGKIRSGKNVWIAFWDGYVNWNSLYTYIFSDLYKWYDQFLNKSDLIQNIEPRQTHNSTITHVILAYFYDLEHADDIVNKFLDRADRLTNTENAHKLSIDHCIQQIGITIKDKRNDSEFNKQKLINIWRRPFVSQHTLDTWFINSPLDKKTTISLYREHINKYSKNFTFNVYSSIKTFCSYLKDFPLEVADCINTLIDTQDNNYLPMEEIKDIVKSLLRSGDEQVEIKCRMIIEKATLRNHDWKDLL